MLHLQSVEHRYSSGAQPVIAIAEWSLAAGQHVLVRGVSGSGKTTLFNIIAGLLRPTQGSVTVAGQSLYTLPEFRRDAFRARTIGYVFQNHHLLPALNALENVIMPLAFAGMSAAARRRRAQTLLEAVGLAQVMRQRPPQLSTGQRLRVAVARALANTPRLLLADEPTAALDAASAANVMDVIQSECRAQDALLLVASHDPALAPRFDSTLDLRGAP
jgi:ABC-type lipoprotein export system ATPase subunit